MRILLVEDEPVLGDAIADELRDELYAVDLARDGDTAAELMMVNEYDGVVLDHNIPGPTGLELLRQWRQQELKVPILMLTARSSLDDCVRGLDAGADDYLAKPFQFSELKARVRSLLRRRPRPGLPRLQAGDLEMDTEKRLVGVNGNVLKLSQREYGVLEYLLKHRGYVVSRRDLVEKVWQDDPDPQTNVVEVFIHRLRRKIGRYTDSGLIHTVKGVGYRLAEEPS